MTRAVKKPAARAKLPLGKKLLYSAMVLFGLLGFVEGSFRALGIGRPQHVEDYIANWELQWSADFYVIDPDLEDRVAGINADGLRDRQRSVEKPPGTTRIVCLGDSVTFGFGLRTAESYPSRLETMLLEKHRRAEVFNVALPGWSTRQQRIAYRRIARKYSPDYVILGICLNDIPEMKNNLAEPPPAATAFLYRNSNVFRWLLRPHAREIHRVEELFEYPDEPRIQQGWSLLFDEIDRLSRDVAADGAKLALLVFPFRFQVEDSVPEPIPQRLIEIYCRQQGIRCFDPLQELQALGPRSFIDHDHLSPVGATAIARLVTTSDWLSEP